MDSNKPGAGDPFAPRYRPGTLVFAAAIALLALLLLALIGEQTKFIKGMKFIAQPRFWPGLALAGCLLSSLAYLFFIYNSNQQHSKSVVQTELLTWLKPLEYAAYFMVYVFGVGKLGYLPATLLFCPALAYRLGYRQVKMLWIAAGFGVLVVLFFKSFLQIKIPGGELYELLPGALRNFMILYL